MYIKDTVTTERITVVTYVTQDTDTTERITVVTNDTQGQGEKNLNKRQRKQNWQSRMDKPETMATLGTRLGRRKAQDWAEGRHTKKQKIQYRKLKSNADPTKNRG